MINWLIRIVSVLVLTPAMWVLVEEGGYFLTENLPRASSNWVLYGFGLYLLFYPFFLGRAMVFVEILEHEVTHAIFGFLSFRDVPYLVVNPSGGGGVTGIENGTGSTTLIRLAPYCLPPVALLPMLFKWLAFPDSHGPLDLLIGLTLAFHFVGLLRELAVRQPDVWLSGPVLATWIIIFANTLLFVLDLGVALSDYAGLKAYFASSMARIPMVYNDIMAAVAEGVRWVSGLE